MALSNRALNYLNKQRRVIGIINNNDTLPYEELFGKHITRKMLSFHGYTLSLNKEDIFVIDFGSINTSWLKSINEVDKFSIKDGFMIEFGEHSRAQLNFFIKDSGEIGAGGININIFSSSVDKFIEGFALKNELLNRFKKDKFFYTLTNTHEILNTFSKDFTKDDNTSDKYNIYLSNDNMALHIGTFYDRENKFISIYAKSQSELDDFKKRHKIT